MAQKKKKLSKREQKRKQENKILCISLGMLLVAIITLFNLGFIGRFLTSIFKLFVGNSYYLVAIALIALSGYQIIKREYFKPLHIRFLGIIFLYLGILLICSLQLELYDNKSMLSSTFAAWHAGYSDVGGGLLGALLYQGLAFLISRIGVYIVSLLLLAVGSMITFNISINKIIKLWHSMISILKHWFLSLQDMASQSKDDNIDSMKQRKDSEQVIREEEPKQQAIIEDVSIYEPISDTPQEEAPTIKEDLPPMIFDDEDNDYQLPPISLLQEIAPVDQSGEKRNVEYKKQILKQTFDSFGVDATVEDYHVGPAITKFEIKLAVGVKVSKIINLADDLALALAAKDVRIEAPIPGKSLIGIEVPNQSVSMVSFREVMGNKPQISHHKLLEVPLGKNISGEVIMADLAKMPHLLIAGSTGSGKSVCINGIITSLLMQAKPHEVKLMMIDPKMVELSSYNGIPHLLTPVVTNPRQASQALHKMVAEMERRYELFAKTGVRNMAGYNEYVQKHSEENLSSMPYIVVIVDELADLMMVASREVEDAITRLAQMARAAGIHMILATQRPSVDVITGLIKANVPSRIAFAVSSGTDSRTILDSNGAEKLLGRGDMLFMPIGENKPMRVQGAFISDAEVANVVNFITDQKGPDYQEEMKPSDDYEINDGESKAPARFEEAVDLVMREQKASASMIQRRLHIGYNTAANIIEEMENRGMIGPANGSKPREVYMKPEQQDSNE